MPGETTENFDCLPETTTTFVPPVRDAVGVDRQPSGIASVRAHMLDLDFISQLPWAKDLTLLDAPAMVHSATNDVPALYLLERLNEETVSA